jgi:hypothetical protein
LKFICNWWIKIWFSFKIFSWNSIIKFELTWGKSFEIDSWILERRKDEFNNLKSEQIVFNLFISDLSIKDLKLFEFKWRISIIGRNLLFLIGKLGEGYSSDKQINESPIEKTFWNLKLS